jgi:Xaa-Pro aminopeptidase
LAVTTELEIKVARLRGWCEQNGYAGVYLRRRANFAWLSCGHDSTVERCVEWGSADLLVTPDRLLVVASEIERYRIVDEELRGLGFELAAHPWGGRSQQDVADRLRGGKRMASDCTLPGFEDRTAAIAKLRWSLTPDEVARARSGAREAARNFERVCREITPGVTEHEVAARLASGALRTGGDAPVVLVAFDERMFAYRHPVPTGRKLQRLALLVRCSQQGGLITSISRIVSFGEPDAEFRRRYAACARVNAEFISATRPGAVASEIFARGVAAYAAGGYPDEWTKHHQGGALGYCCRDYIADASCGEVVQADQLFGWNPSIAGTKLEDTILVSREGQDILTEMPGWPSLEVEAGGRMIRCPDILVYS